MCTSAAAYGARVDWELAGGGEGGAPPMAPEWVAVKHILLLGILWALQTFLFAVRFRTAFAIQLVAVAAGAAAAGSLACALKGREVVEDAAARLCGWAEAAAVGTLGVAGAGGGRGDSAAAAAPRGACGAAPVEYWVVLVFAFSSLLPVGECFGAFWRFGRGFGVNRGFGACARPRAPRRRPPRSEPALAACGAGPGAREGPRRRRRSSIGLCSCSPSAACCRWVD